MRTWIWEGKEKEKRYRIQKFRDVKAISGIFDITGGLEASEYIDRMRDDQMLYREGQKDMLKASYRKIEEIERPYSWEDWDDC